MSSLLKALVGTGRPPHAFVLTRERVVYVRRESVKGAAPSLGGPAPFSVFARPLPPDALRPGPGGIPVAGAAFAGAVGALVTEAGGKIPAASLVVPDDFVHVITVDLEDPDKSPKEAEEVLLWKLGKTFGDPAPPVRLAWQGAGPGASGTRVLAIAAPEEAVTSWEAPFLQAGIRIGAVETAAIAMASFGRKAVSGNGFLLWADGDAATTIFLRDGNVRFLRTKATADPDEALQEIRLAASFVASDGLRGGAEAPALDIDGPCAAGPVGSPIVDRFRAFRAEGGGRDPVPLTRATILPEAPGAPGVKRKGDDDPAVLVALCAMAGE